MCVTYVCSNATRREIMIIPLDYTALGIAVPPSPPLWYTIPFILFLALLLIGGVGLGDRQLLRERRLGVLLPVVLGAIALFSFFPFGAVMVFVITVTMANAYELPVWMTIYLIAITFGTYLLGMYVWQNDLRQSFE